MKQIAESYTRQKVEQAIVAVPVHFSNFERTAIKHAAYISGFSGIRIVNKSSAAAISRDLIKSKQSDKSRNILVFESGSNS